MTEKIAEVRYGRGVYHALCGPGHRPAQRGASRGVRIEDILDALEHPVQVTEIAVDREGLRGYVIIGKTCRCAVNPDTNKLIMVAPHR